MPLILTEEQTMLKEAADGFLNEIAPLAHLRKLRDSRDADGVSRDLWRAFGEMGLAGVIIPEAHGGAGLGAVEAGVVAESLGRTLTPSPFMGSAVLSARVLVEGGSEAQQAAWLPKIDSIASVVPPRPRPVRPRPAMIWFALSFSTTNQKRTEATMHTPTAISNASTIDCVNTMPRIVAQAPAIISPSRPRCQMPARCAITPASVT